MKKLFLTMVALMVATLSFAQSSVLATLSHDGEISTFYGASALKSAHAAAQHGDIITLSSGSFEAVNITKAITIRGAGMQTDSISKIYPSVIVGSFYIDIADSLEQRLTVEGVYCNDYTVTVYHTLSNATFIKTRFYKFVSNSSSTSTFGYGFMKNVAFIHCKIASMFSNEKSSNTLSFVNSVIMNPRLGYSTYTNNSFEFTNCVVGATGTSLNIYYAIFRNSIIRDSSSLNSTNLLYNCVGISSVNIFDDYSMNYKAEKTSDVFKTWTGTYSDLQDFELTDSAKKKYLGDDEKEVGIYGGNLPFSPNPTNPKITKFNVASKSTADGKLSVDIEVKAAE